MKSRLMSLAVLLVLLFWAGNANSTLLYNNLNSTNSGADGVTSFGPLGDSFSTGAGGFALGDVKLLLLGDSTTSGSISVDLFSDNSTSPGTLLQNIGSLSDSSLTSSLSVFDFSLGLSYALAANTRYWIVVSSTDSSAQWGWSLDNSALGVAGEYFSNVNGVFPNTDGPYQMQLGSGGSTVPEPGTMLLLGLGLALLAAFRMKFLAA